MGAIAGLCCSWRTASRATVVTTLNPTWATASTLAVTACSAAFATTASVAATTITYAPARSSTCIVRKSLPRSRTPAHMSRLFAPTVLRSASQSMLVRQLLHAEAPAASAALPLAALRSKKE